MQSKTHTKQQKKKKTHEEITLTRQMNSIGLAWLECYTLMKLFSVLFFFFLRGIFSFVRQHTKAYMQSKAIQLNNLWTDDNTVRIVCCFYSRKGTFLNTEHFTAIFFFLLWLGLTGGELLLKKEKKTARARYRSLTMFHFEKEKKNCCIRIYTPDI